MKHSVEYAVLGAGVIGSSCAYLAARAGYSVALIEQFEVGHNRGSSHGESRITRLSYDLPIYVQMARRTFELWAEVEQSSGEQLYLRTGGLDIGIAGDSRLEACRLSMEAEKVPYEVLDRAEINARYPQFRLRTGVQGLVQEQTGILSASLCVKTLAALAVSNGALLLQETEANRIELAGNKVVIHANEHTVEASYLVICAGAWAGPLLRKLGLELSLTVTKEQWAFFDPLEPDMFVPGKFPVFIDYQGREGSGGIGWYGFPIFGKPGVKTSVHRCGAATTANTRTFEVDEEKLAELKNHMTEILPAAAGEVISTGTCLYTNSDDTHFVIDYLPGHKNVVLFTGCSGHSFKFGPVIAETLISLLRGTAMPSSMDLFTSKRFAWR